LYVLLLFYTCLLLLSDFQNANGKVVALICNPSHAQRVLYNQFNSKDEK